MIYFWQTPNDFLTPRTGIILPTPTMMETALAIQNLLDTRISRVKRKASGLRRYHMKLA